MWMPREPEVFGQPTSPTASSDSRATSATSRICDHGDAGHRVEVDAQLVGMVEVVGPDRVRVEVDAAEVDDPGQAAASSTTISSAVRPDGKVSVAVRIQSGAFSGARFWKNGSPAAPSTKRLSAIGRPPAPRSAPVGDGQVVVDEVELGVAGLREVDLARVGDRDLAPADLEDLLLGRHRRHDTAQSQAAAGSTRPRRARTVVGRAVHPRACRFGGHRSS